MTRNRLLSCLAVTGAQAKLFVEDLEKPVLVMDDLKSGLPKGQVALAVLTGATYFSNFEIRATPDAPWERRLPAMPAGTLTKWSITPALDALARDLEKPLTKSESDGMAWQEVQARPACASGVSICSLIGRSKRPLKNTAWSWQPAHHLLGCGPMTSCIYSTDLR